MVRKWSLLEICNMERVEGAELGVYKILIEGRSHEEAYRRPNQSLRLVGRRAERGVVRGWNRHRLVGFRQGKHFRGGFLARPLFGDGEELGGVGVEWCGWSTGRAAGSQSREWRFASGNGWREYSDLLVGGLLDPTLKLSHLIHCHVFKKKKRKIFKWRKSTLLWNV